ncbi:hypothetical protein FXO38_32909 [Capsicum annuum]|uniref:Uncharacterized protein n=1 Tax=Capsicum annuum TaxID=4072 RepID=A0A2G3A9A6_CAPAN|nr:hypothetical protein FXO38_32909 [Capsicum annuum]PHT90788.1 hypothetical protein T459_05901 [Capsicum annuum]
MCFATHFLKLLLLPKSEFFSAVSDPAETYLELVVTSEGLLMIYSGLKPSLLEIAMTQGVYYYFYQVFKNKVKAITTADKKRGQGDGSAGMFSWLVCRLIHKQKGKLLRSYRFMNQELQDSGKELSNHQSLFLIPQFSS